MRKSVLLLCLVLLLLCGCETETPPPVTTAPATTVPAPTQETVPTEPPLIEFGAVTPLSGHSFSEAPAICILDERTLAMVHSEYIAGENAGTVTRVVVVDLYTDTILAEHTFPTALRSGLQTSCPGFLPLFDPIEKTCTLYDAALTPLLTFQAQKLGGVFSGDGAAYYYISGQRLYQMDIASGESEQILLDIELPLEKITGYDPVRDLLALDVHTRYYLDVLCPGLVDLQTGQFQVLTREGNQCIFTADGLGLRFSDPLHLGTNLLLTQPGAEEGLQLINFLAQDKDYSTIHVGGSNYVLRNRYNPKQGHKYLNGEILTLGSEIRACDITELLGDLELRNLYLLPDGKLLGISREKKVTQPVVICPELLTFEPLLTPEAVEPALLDSTIVEDYAQEALPVEVAPELAEVRAIADGLEQTYGITILISNQCDSIVEAFGYPLQPTDQAHLKDEAKSLKIALEYLDESLAMFPEGFFRQFRNEVDERGLLVMLVEDIAYGYYDSSVDILGVTYEMGDWYPIAVDITTKDLNQTYCHEIWHAIENKIDSENRSLLSSAAWNALNPEGFAYPSGTVSDYYNDTEHTFIRGGCGEESYFVDSYGKTSPYEDRARLLEYVMTSEFYARRMMQAPALYGKMEIMINAIRQVFDTTGWEDVRWERFHTS